ncbi:MAG: glycosyltransferase family 4 protein [Candidatus Thiodiazotropha sp.]
MINVTIIYPTDPFGVVPGGTDTCIRDILRCSPDDIQMNLVGVTTNPDSYPVGIWTKCEINGRAFSFFPLMLVSSLKEQMRIPLSLQFTLRLIGKRKLLADSDVIQFNRIEPALSVINLKKPKILIIHQNMNVIKNNRSDIRWKYFPGLYFKIEEYIINHLRSIFIVREDAVEEYKKRFPDKRDDIKFLPTWMNASMFFQLEKQEKLIARNNLSDIDVTDDEYLMIFVGRLDHQKDPIFLIQSLVSLNKKRKDWKMIIIGDGILRGEIESAIQKYNLYQKVSLTGAMSQEDVSKYLRASDLLLLTSVYEGMPRCVVEALGCGLPVVSTRAGEVSLLIKQGENGYIVDDRDPEEFSDKINKTINNLQHYNGASSLDAVKQYTASNVLEEVYDMYRRLGSE